MLPIALLVLTACTAGTEPDAEGPGEVSMPPVTGEGLGATELPPAEDLEAVLTSSGDVTGGFTGNVTPEAPVTADVPEVAAGSVLLRVACTSDDGAPVTVSVAAAGAPLTSYQAPCVPVFEGGSTMADSDAFQVPGGALQLTVEAPAEAVVAIGFVPAA